MLTPAMVGMESPIIQALLSSTDYGILMTDHSGNDILCNSRFGQLFDIDPAWVVRTAREEVRREAMARVKDPAEFEQLIERIYADPTLEREDEIQLKTDPPRYLRRYTGPVLDADGRNIGRVWTFQDVTEMRRLQAEVQAYAARLEEQFAIQSKDLRFTQAALQTMIEIFAAIAAGSDRDTLLRAIAQSTQKLPGYAVSALLLLSEEGHLNGFLCDRAGEIQRVEVEISHADLITALLEAETAGDGTPQIIRCQHPCVLSSALKCPVISVAPLRHDGTLDGILAWGSDTPAPRMDAHRLTHLRAIVHQVTLALETHRLQRNLQAAYDELCSAQESMMQTAKLGVAGALAASIAHDIRNILTPLQLEIASAGNSEALTAARAHVDRLFALTYRLLAVARPTALHPGPLNLAEVVRHIMPLIEPQATVDGISLRARFERKLPEIYGDRGRLEHLFVNLFLNALNAMSARGGTLSVSAARDGDRVRVDVRDTGPGIQPEYLPRLFDPFFTTRANGSGLGLYSVKRIVEEHHGEIKIQSKLGRGTCFSLWLPTAESVAERVDTD
jgi:signal transduction histidine kinase